MNPAPPAAGRRWRIAGLLAGAIFLVLVGRHWRPVYRFTDLIQLDAGNDELKLAAFRERPIYVYRNTGGYDGLYYAQIAYDPLLGNPELRRAVDSLTYRARRILPSAAAWLFSAGRPDVIVHVYSVLNIVVWLAFAPWLWRRIPVVDGRGFLAWAGVLFSAGALASVRFSLTDLPATALLAAAVGAAEERRTRTGGLWLGAAALTRETSLGALVATADPPWLSARNVRLAALAALPLAGWIAFVRWRLGANDTGLSNLTWPLVSYTQKWTEILGAFSTEGDWRPVATGLLALVGVTVQAAYVIAQPHWRDRWWRLGAAFVGLALFLSTAVWEGLPGAFTRVLLPLTLAFNVLAARRRASLAWLVAGNLAIFSGLGALGDVHRDPQELAEQRDHGVPLVATLGRGWFGMEQTRRHQWTWCGQRGEIALQTWPAVDRVAVLGFALRATSPRVVTAWQDGREIWRGEIGTTRGGRAHLTCRLTQGRGTLEFRTAAPPVREGAGAGARDLSFALYDAELELGPP